MSKYCSTAHLEITETQETTVEVYYVFHRIVTTHVSKQDHKLTVYPCPAPIFKPLTDAEIFQKMFECGKIDEGVICKIITCKSSPQRLEIVEEFEKQFGKNLIIILKEKLHGEFKKLVVALLTRPSEYLASELHHAIEGFGTDERTLIEIICTATNYQIEYIKASYKKLFGNNLVDDVKGDTSGSFKKLLVLLLQGKRSENEDVCEEEVMKDVSDLIAAIICPKRNSQLEDVVTKILAGRSYVHLKQMFGKFFEIVQCSLQAIIKQKFGGDFGDALLAIINVIENRPHFFAERIKDCIAGWGTKDRQLIRIVVSRCEVDLKEIKEEYLKCNKKRLEDEIAADTTGWYKKTLLCLVQDDD